MAILARGDVALDVDLSGFSSSLRSAVAGAVGSIGAIIGGAFAGVKVGSFLKDSIGQAIDLHEAINKLGVAFGDSASQVLALGDNSAHALGQSKLQVLDAAGGFGVLLTSLGVTQQKAAEMSVQLVQLATDISSLQNVATADVLVALRSGLVGETEPLRRLGIAFDDQTLKAKASELGLQKFGKAASTAGSTAKAVAHAVEHLGDVQRNGAERIEDIQRSAARAAEAAQERIASATRRVAATEERLIDVNRSAKVAQDRLNDARREARQRLDDLSFAVGDNALKQKQANLNIKQALAEQKRINADAEASDLDRQQAALDVQQARRDAAESARDSTREEQELAAAQKKGINGSEQVVSALNDIADAEKAIRDAKQDRSDAEQDLVKANLEAARQQEDSARELARAQEDVARDITRAQQSIAEAGQSAASSIASQSDTLTPVNKALAAYALILEKGKVNMGDFANTADSPANKLRILGAEVDDLKARIGERLLPVFERFLEFVESQVIPFLDRNAIPTIDRIAQVLEFVREHALGLAIGLGLLVAAFDAPLAVGAAFVALLGLIIAKVPVVREAFVLTLDILQTVGEAVLGVIDFVTEHWRGITEILLGPLGLALVWIVDHFNSIKEVVLGVIRTIARAWNDTLGRIPGFPHLNENFGQGEDFSGGPEFTPSLPPRGRARGGPIGPGWWLVGENGPELMRLGAGTSGRVFSNGESQRIANDNRNVTINVHEAVDAHSTAFTVAAALGVASQR